MKRLFSFLLIILTCQMNALEKLDEVYLVTYGNPQASYKVVEYYSFMCPHCIALFRRDFNKIRKDFIDNDQIYWVFHPVPLDMPTLQAMICLKQLTSDQKRLFLEVILAEADIEDSTITSALMQQAMKLFQKPIQQILEQEFILKSLEYLDAFEFVKQEDRMNAVPTVEIDGKIYPEEVPDYSFIEKTLKALKEKT